MIGKTFFEDLNIDAQELEFDMEHRAKLLIDEWGPKLTEADLLQMNALVHASSSNAENSIAAYALEYYLTKDYKPEYIHKNNFPHKKKPWWKFW